LAKGADLLPALAPAGRSGGIGLDLLRELPNKDAETSNFVAVASVVTGDAKAKSVKKIATADPVLAATMKLAGLPAPAARQRRRNQPDRRAPSRSHATDRSRCRTGSMPPSGPLPPASFRSRIDRAL
jgi:hypothetical protein